jgi:F-type H+-transporting ATPase subunit alpha
MELLKDMNDLPDSLKSIVKGGGSLTALPLSKLKLVISAYPNKRNFDYRWSNFLDGDLFNSGFVQQLT